MGKLSKPVSYFLVAAEAILVIYYFFNLVPSYNRIKFESIKLAENQNVACNLFITQQEAQQYFDSNSKVKGLDNDNDGIACENLP